jgi:hypothetical protein
MLIGREWLASVSKLEKYKTLWLSHSANCQDGQLLTSPSPDGLSFLVTTTSDFLMTYPK